MKQQTAIQELIENLDHELKSRGMIVNWDMYLGKEKEQIKEAYNHGWDDREYEVEDSWKKDADEKYFNETYGQ
jgi:hypothetical protein